MGAAVKILYDDCVRVLENWGEWARQGRARLGYKRKANFYSVGGGSAITDDDLAQWAESAMCAMTANGDHNVQYVNMLRLKYYNRLTDRQIVARLSVSLRSVQITKECAHQMFYDYMCRIGAQR